MAGEFKIVFTRRGKLAKFDEMLSFPAGRPLIFGRSSSADVYLEESDVSGKHMELRFEADGCHAVCVSKHGMKVNERKVLHCESVKLALDDEVMLGTQVRFRVKELPDAPCAGEDAETGAGGETIALQDDGGTLATRPLAEVTMATRPVEATIATRPLAEATMETRPVEATMATGPVAEESTIATRPADTASFGRTAVIEGTPVGESVSVDVEAARFDDSVTGDPEGDDANTSDSATMQEAMSGQTIGLTEGGMTRPFDMNQARIIDDRMQAARKARQTLRVFLLLLVLTVSGAAVWLLSPKDEKLVNFRMVNGVPDMETHQVSDADGNRILDVYYQRDDRMKKVNVGGVFSVETFTGRKGNVPYRLMFATRRNINELALSLAESFSVWRKECEEREKIVFLDSSTGKWGMFFFEDRYPAPVYCQRNSLHGMACVSSEYTKTVEGKVWHGVVLYFRDGDHAYVLRREIPEQFWVKGEWLMGNNPNLAVYSKFNLDRWESPGGDKLKIHLSVKELMADARSMLAAHRISNWDELGKTVDTLMVKTWGSKGEDRTIARKLLTEFRARKDIQYKILLNSFENFRQNGDFAGMKRVFSECQAVFGNDSGDRRYSIFNNPEIWSCRKK